MKNVLNRFVPRGYIPFQGSKTIINSSKRKLIPEVYTSNANKLCGSLAEVFDKLNITDGMTLSFHHHLRNGDYCLNMVMQEASKRGIKNLTLAPSSLFPVHAPLVPLIENQTVTKIYTNYLNGPVAKAISEGKLKELLVMQTHGGRARAIEAGELSIDVAFVAAPAADKKGNANGVDGPSACGALGYAIPDVKYAKKVVIITDNLVENLDYIEIDEKYVDYVVVADKIGEQSGIVSGTTKITRDPVALKIARNTAQLLNELGLIKNGFSLQTGAGGTSLAVASEVKKIMLEKNITASFASGGITAYFVEMLEAGLINELWDVQCFDLEAVRSYKVNKKHYGMSSSKYANPYEEDVVVNKLDFVILGATEIDLNFNVNVTTDSKGLLIGGSGGHSDTAAGANVTIITTPLIKSRIPIIKEELTTISTPGEDVDVLVTERGIAINPKRTDLLDKLQNSKLNILPIEQLLEISYQYTGIPEPIKKSDKVIGVVEYRDGTIIDSIYKLGED